MIWRSFQNRTSLGEQRRSIHNQHPNHTARPLGLYEKHLSHILPRIHSRTKVVPNFFHQIGVYHILALSLLTVTLPIRCPPSAYLESHNRDGLLSVPDDCRVVVAGGGKQTGACLKRQSVDLEKTAVVSLSTSCRMTLKHTDGYSSCFYSVRWPLPNMLVCGKKLAVTKNHFAF
jgi:hypothetical protein